MQTGNYFVRHGDAVCGRKRTLTTRRSFQSTGVLAGRVRTFIRARAETRILLQGVPTMNREGKKKGPEVVRKWQGP